MKFVVLGKYSTQGLAGFVKNLLIIDKKLQKK